MSKMIREHTINRLLLAGFKINSDVLPTIKREESKNKIDICKRAIILTEFKSLTLYPEDFEDALCWMKENDIFQSLSNYEQRAIIKGKFTNEEEINFSWYKESLLVLLWYIGIADDIPFPSNECNIISYVKHIPPDIEMDVFFQKATARKKLVLLTELDYYYHLHWIVRHQKNNNLNKSVVIERRKALEWIADVNLNWDNISLDT